MTQALPPDITSVVGRCLADLLASPSAGSGLDVDPAGDLLSALELLVPDLLSSAHEGWRRGESLEGADLSSAVATGPRSAAFAGTCILISDQTVTPFALEMTLSADHRLGLTRVRLGQPGPGKMGLLRHPVHSSAANELLARIEGGYGDIHWVYDVTVDAERRGASSR